MPGSIDKYEVLRTLGHGASCKVKLGRDPETGAKVAIKIMKSDMDDGVRALLFNEVEAMQNLQSH